MTYRSSIAALFIFYLLAYPARCEALAVSKVNMNEIHALCKNSPAQCLPVLDEKLLNTPKQSRVWYDLMQYKIESLFLLQNIKALYENTKPWINKDDLPVPFKISVYIYYAKSLKFSNISDKALLKTEKKKYIKKAEQQIALMHDAYPDPMLVIQLANIKMVVGEIQTAYQSLKDLEVKYKRHPNPELKLDLYGNLAHLAGKLGDTEQAISYWLECLIWAKEFNNNQQIATVYYNLANSQTTNNQFIEAKQSYLSAIHYATAASDGAKRAQSQYSLAKLMLQQGLRLQAKEILQTMDVSKLPVPMEKELQLIRDSN